MIVPNHWSAKMGGSQYQAERVVNVLIDDPVNEVTCLSRLIDSHFQPRGYRMVQVNSKWSVPRYRRICDIPGVISALAEINPDVIYQRVGGAYTGAAAYYAKHAACRMIWHIASDTDVLPYRECLNRGANTAWLEKRILEYGLMRASKIIAQTKIQAQLLASNYGREAAAIIPNFHPSPSEIIDKSGELKVVWIANIKPLKQPELFLQLARELSDIEGVRFVMIGEQSTDVSWQKTLDNMAAGLHNFDYLGRRTQDEVNAMLSGAHLLVNTSRYEGFSNTFVQAWMRRVPVISLSVNPDSLLDSGMLGICSGNYEQLRSDVKGLLQQPKKLEQMGRDAALYAMENHSERNITKLIDILFS